MVLVTGATGRLGNLVVRRLRAQGADVRCLVRKGSEFYWLNATGARYVFGDLQDGASLARALQGVRRLVVCSGVRTEGRRDNHTSVTAEGHARLFEVAGRHNVERVVFVSCLGVGRGGRSAAFEALTRAEEALAASGLPHHVLRPSLFAESFANVAHAAQRLRFIPLWGPGDNPVSPIAIDDVALVATRLLDKDPPEGGRTVVEIGGPDTMPFKEAARRACTAVGLPGATSWIVRVPPVAPRLERLSRRLSHRLHDLELETRLSLDAPPHPLVAQPTPFEDAVRAAWDKKPWEAPDMATRAEQESYRTIEPTRYQPGEIAVTELPEGPRRLG